jgi:formate dehydrogenase (NADP+) beta subunit
MIRPPASSLPDTAWFAASVSCRAACPVGTDAAGYVQAIADGRLTDAYDLARAHNPFPSVCGRVCSAPCEKACRRGVIDAPIAIRALKRVACEQGGVEGGDPSRWHRAHGPVPPATRESIGIIGAGPAGLAAAYLLRLAGHPVTMYERDAEPGGMLLTGIPAFRLPRDVVRQEIAALLSLDITLVSGCELGRDRSLDQLLSVHRCVLITAGCSRGRGLPMPGADDRRVVRAIDFLRAFNAGTLGPVAAPVVVIGGGSVAFDAARSAQRAIVAREESCALHAAIDPTSALVPAVQLVAPEAYDALPVPTEELREAAAEGVIVRAGVGIRGIEPHDDAISVVVAPVASLYDEHGRFRPSLQDGHDERVTAGLVILAVGQHADVTFVPRDVHVSGGSWSGVLAAADGRTAEARVYAAGDVSTGPGDLIDAIASGQRAARSIIADLGGAGAEASPPPPVAEPLALERRYWSGYDTIARRELPVLPTANRSRDGEVEGVLTLKDARREASRCLLCDTHIVLDAPLCIGCALCVDVCPYGCIALVADGDGPVASGASLTLQLDETACIRCGLCVDRCPPHALDLIRV